MIDYDKLKLAHELAEKYYNKTGEPVTIEINVSYGCHKDNPYIIWFYKTPYAQESIDSMIIKLRELTEHYKPIHKDAWYISSRCEGIKCTKVLNREGYVVGPGTSVDAFGATMYPSREALIEAQIKYWKGLSAITDGYTPVVGQHESDGLIYTSISPQIKNV